MSRKSNQSPSLPNKLMSGEIKQLLLQAIDRIEKLHLSLEEEYRALSSNNLNAFERSVESKIVHTGDLETIEKSIFSLLKNSGFKMNKQGVADYVATFRSNADKKNITTLWKQMSEALLKCQQQNQVNGRILNMASVNIRQALEILTGKRGAPKTYSSQGKQSKGNNSSSIAIA